MKKRGKIELVDKGEMAVKDKLITITETQITGVDDITFDL